MEFHWCGRAGHWPRSSGWSQDKHRGGCTSQSHSPGEYVPGPGKAQAVPTGPLPDRPVAIFFQHINILFHKGLLPTPTSDTKWPEFSMGNRSQ